MHNLPLDQNRSIIAYVVFLCYILCRMETAALRLKWARQQHFRSAAQFARTAGVSEVTYRAHENGTRGLTSTVAQLYAKTLGVDFLWLLLGRGEIPPGVPYGSAAGRGEPAPIPGGSGGGADLPIYATIEHGELGMVLMDEVIDWAARPLPLQKVRDGFAAYVVGDAMAPGYENGDLIFIHPRRPPERGKDVLLAGKKVKGERRVLLRRLSRWTAEKWTTLQYEPERQAEYLRSEWPHVFRVIGKINS